jgi:hypothetical protein
MVGRFPVTAGSVGKVDARSPVSPSSVPAARAYVPDVVLTLWAALVWSTTFEKLTVYVPTK